MRKGKKCITTYRNNFKDINIIKTDQTNDFQQTPALQAQPLISALPYTPATMFSIHHLLSNIESLFHMLLYLRIQVKKCC